MTSTSYTRWGECVNSDPSKIPNVILKQQAMSYDHIFRILYRDSDLDGHLELRADEIASETGYSRKTVYKVIKFLQRVRLLFLIESRTGRGHHSVYRLNWRKPKESGDSTRSTGKCHPPYKTGSINTIHRSSESSSTERPAWESNPFLRCRYLTSGWNELRKGQYGYKRAAKLFRLSCWSLGLPPEPAEGLSGLLLKRLEGQNAQLIRKVHDRLFAHLSEWRDKLHRLVRRGIPRLCSWVGWLLQRLLANIRAEEAAREQAEAEWAEADRRADRQHAEWLADLKSASLDRRRRYCQNSLTFYVAALEDLHGGRAPDDVVDARCAELAAEFSVPKDEIYAGVDRDSLSLEEAIDRLYEEESAL